MMDKKPAKHGYSQHNMIAVNEAWIDWMEAKEKEQAERIAEMKTALEQIKQIVDLQPLNGSIYHIAEEALLQQKERDSNET